ncbi:hypothetical protein GDO81_014738 [Engystomops pustulosus]|uniref:Ig-like domain-containing protein n=1 Tax=Engystomops pustulosus TaxID=76066 RepID=A0AAV7AKN5_ENGPU|nr:hypothetical protein GDO81_014738 [Engystomops pustulosus]KAG8560016.1 hypothetical protein GDO81_014738 [Engystomops pustulosus]
MKVWIALVLSTYIQGLITHGNIPDLSHVDFVEKGKNINISCNTVKTFDNTQWYKEKEDGGLAAVSRSGCHTPSGKYIIHCDKSVTTMEITNVTKSDSGVYYCAQSGLDQTFHLTRTLIVTDHNPMNPKLTILSSVEDHPNNSETTVFLCVALDWTKEWDLIQWTMNDTKQDGWITLDPDGSLQSLLVIQRSTQYAAVSCYIKKTRTNEIIHSNFTLGTMANMIDVSGEKSSKDCYIVLYVGLPIIITIILIHLIIILIRKRTLVKDTPPPATTPQEHRVRSSPQDESVIYSAVKS